MKRSTHDQRWDFDAGGEEKREGVVVGHRVAGDEHISVEGQRGIGLVAVGVGLDDGIVDEGGRGGGEVGEDEVGVVEVGGIEGGVCREGDELGDGEGGGDGGSGDEVGVELGGLG